MRFYWHKTSNLSLVIKLISHHLTFNGIFRSSSVLQNIVSPIHWAKLREKSVRGLCASMTVTSCSVIEKHLPVRGHLTLTWRSFELF